MGRARVEDGGSGRSAIVFFCDREGCGAKALSGQAEGWVKAGAIVGADPSPDDVAREGRLSWRFYFCPLHAADARSFGGANETYAPADR